MDIKILDCTLRDGGHVNNGNFGADNIRRISKYLSIAGVDVIEMGFLKNGNFTDDQALFNKIQEVNRYIGKDKKQEYSIMIRPDWYDIKQLDIDADRIRNIRFAFYFRDANLTEEYSKYVRKRGYNIWLNPVNIVSYDKIELRDLITFVNHIHPNYMSIVDTFGSMSFDELSSIYNTIEEKLDSDIGIGLHLHDNMMLSYSLMQFFLKNVSETRKLTIDGSLDGMGRIPGNLPVEILADYLNMAFGKAYDIKPLFQIIGESIMQIKEKKRWGYSAPYFLSGKLRVHRSYPEYYLSQNIDYADIYSCLVKLSQTKYKWAFDQKVAEDILRKLEK